MRLGYARLVVCAYIALECSFNMEITVIEESLSPTAKRLLSYAQGYAERRSAVLLKELGSGGSASVFLLASDKAQTALKVYDPRFLNESNGPAEKRRIELQRRLIGSDCPNLVSVVDIALEAGTCFIEMEYVNWRNLKEAISEVPPEKVESLFHQLVLAVQYLDDNGLVHRDIKPENIMVDEKFEHLKLIDFGVMREVDGEEDAIDATDHGLRRPFIASAQYSSPEYLFRLKEPSPEMWRALTIYQLGGVLHDLLTRRPLFDEIVKAENKFALAMAVLTKVPSLAGTSASVKTWAVVAANCLVKDPDLRLALVDIKRIVPATGRGAERLKQLGERRWALRQAQEERDQADAQIKKARITELGALQTHVRSGLAATAGKAYGVVVGRHGDEQVTFAVAMGRGVELQIVCHFEWLASFTPLVANVFLTASLGVPPIDARLSRRAVGQAVASGDVEGRFADVMLDVVCEVVAAVAENLVLGSDEDREIQFVDAGLLLASN